MFDPSIFDNLKVVLEGILYDLDREGSIQVVNREDLIDLARLKRTFSMRYVLKDQPRISLKLVLSSELEDFAAELVNIRSIDRKPGCTIHLIYSIDDWQPDDRKLKTGHRSLLDMWEQDATLHQNTIKSYAPYSGSDPTDDTTAFHLRHEMIITLNKRIDESHISQIPILLDHTVVTLNYLHSLVDQK